MPRKVPKGTGSNQSWICRSCSLRASRKRIDLPEPEGLICNETGEFAKIIITNASQCWYLHKHNSAILPCKKIHSDDASTAM